MKRRQPALFRMGFLPRARIVSNCGPNCFRFALRALGISVRHNRAEAPPILSGLIVTTAALSLVQKSYVKPEGLDADRSTIRDWIEAMHSPGTGL
jgi:hypothetical protein